MSIVAVALSRSLMSNRHDRYGPTFISSGSFEPLGRPIITVSRVGVSMPTSIVKPTGSDGVLLARPGEPVFPAPLIETTRTQCSSFHDTETKAS